MSVIWTHLPRKWADKLRTMGAVDSVPGSGDIMYSVVIGAGAPPQASICEHLCLINFRCTMVWPLPGTRPKYSQAAEALKNQTSEARLAKVDATEEKELGDEFGVKGYPTILFFKDGNRTSRIDFGGNVTLQ